MKIAVFDTSVGSLNTGDCIIMDAVNKEINLLFKEYMCIRIPTQSKISRLAYIALSKADYKFVGGTNLLSSNMLIRNQWKLDIVDSLFVGNITLMGVGWWQYQRYPDIYTRFLLRKVLSKDALHSVRDSHAVSMLTAIGIRNVLNTSCPTMWNLTEEHCALIPQRKAEDVIVTLTDYNRNPSLDIELLSILRRSYRSLYFWPQGIKDLDYMKSLGWLDKVIPINEGLKAYDNLLSSKYFDLDFIGTRLHAGIRALQNKKRTIIVGIDNRAIEKSKDFNLRVVKRNNLSTLNCELKKDFATEIKLPLEAIRKWKSQFS